MIGEVEEEPAGGTTSHTNALTYPHYPHYIEYNFELLLLFHTSIDLNDFCSFLLRMYHSWMTHFGSFVGHPAGTVWTGWIQVQIPIKLKNRFWKNPVTFRKLSNTEDTCNMQLMCWPESSLRSSIKILSHQIFIVNRKKIMEKSISVPEIYSDVLFVLKVQTPQFLVIQCHLEHCLSLILL